MPHDSRPDPRRNIIETGVAGMKLENGAARERVRSRTHDLNEESPATAASSPTDIKMASASHSPVKDPITSHESTPKREGHDAVVGGDITLKMEPGEPPKLSRSQSHKIASRSPVLFVDCRDRTEEARAIFETIPVCSYTNKYIGSTEHGSMDCDCAEEWDGISKVNAACGDDSDCINRATKMECVGDCGCGADCQNQRFQRKQYAPVTVFKTEKKGYGLRADADLDIDDFIYEYIGEVIGETLFRRRMVQYHEEGIKHFYFMSLTQGEFVDATKKGNLGRFCNHSCNPNCYVDKWVVGDKLRMGIFAERKIKAGEELVFNYNVDRYGADPQPCYCSEPNCTGFIGGKTQTERATKLPHTTIEALGIDDGDGWDTAVAKKPRKKKVGEADEEYVNNVQPKSLDEHGVTKVMATLMQCKEKWIAVKLLGRIQRCDDEKARNRVVKMHGYQILNTNLSLWREDANVVLQIFNILDSFPRLTRNKISDSKIESTVAELKTSNDEQVSSQADHLLQEWATLEVAYRIPRKKRELDTTATPDKQHRQVRRESREKRKGRSRSGSREGSRSSSKSMDAPKGPAAAPSGPRNNFPQRQPGYFQSPRPPFRPRPFNALPLGWFSALDDGGRTYYYDMTGKTTWDRPTAASVPPPPPPKPTSTNKALEDIINEITNAKTTTPKDRTTVATPAAASNGEPKKLSSSGKEKWRNLSEEKQMKLYENTLFPHIKYVMDKFKGKLPKDDLKRFAKEISKKLVTSDFKNRRVEDPTKIDSRKEKQVKTYVKEYFDKAAKKHREREKRRAERKAQQSDTANPSKMSSGKEAVKEEGHSEDEQDLAMSDDDGDQKVKSEALTPATPLDMVLTSDGLKRKRDDMELFEGVKHGGVDLTPHKLLKSETPPPPPPPPPPPAAQGSASDSPADDATMYDTAGFLNGTEADMTPASESDFTEVTRKDPRDRDNKPRLVPA